MMDLGLIRQGLLPGCHGGCAGRPAAPASRQTPARVTVVNRRAAWNWGTSPLKFLYAVYRTLPAFDFSCPMPVTFSCTAPLRKSRSYTCKWNQRSDCTPWIHGLEVFLETRWELGQHSPGVLGQL